MVYEEINMYDLSKYLILYFGRTINDKYIKNQINIPELYYFEDIQYNISSVIYYSKLGKKTGHYTASCKCDNGWYHFNDSSVTKEDNRNKFLKPIILIYERN